MILIANTEFSKVLYISYHSLLHTQYTFVPIFFHRLDNEIRSSDVNGITILRLNISVINFSFFIVPSNELSNSVSFAFTVYCIQLFFLNY